MSCYRDANKPPSQSLLGLHASSPQQPLQLTAFDRNSNVFRSFNFTPYQPGAHPGECPDGSKRMHMTLSEGNLTYYSNCVSK